MCFSWTATLKSCHFLVLPCCAIWRTTDIGLAALARIMRVKVQLAIELRPICTALIILRLRQLTPIHRHNMAFSVATCLTTGSDLTKQRHLIDRVGGLRTMTLPFRWMCGVT